jgi:hypothetical protein
MAGQVSVPIVGAKLGAQWLLIVGRVVAIFPAVVDRCRYLLFAEGKSRCPVR